MTGGQCPRCGSPVRPWGAAGRPQTLRECVADECRLVTTVTATQPNSENKEPL